MKHILLTLLILFIATSAFGADPSPRSKQMHIAPLTYCSSFIWENQTSGYSDYDTAYMDWFANRFSMGVGACDSGSIAYMRTINPDLKFIRYDVYNIPIEESTLVQTWCTAQSVDFDSMVIRADTDAGDSLVAKASSWGDGFDDWRTTLPGEIMRVSAYTTDESVICWDFRNPNVGAYLAYRYKLACDEVGADGIMMDEEFIIGATGTSIAGLMVFQAPFKALTSSFWDYGSPYSWQRPWIGPEDDTLTITEIRDSLALARLNGWYPVMAESMAVNGLKAYPNFSGSGGPYNTMANWNVEAMPAQAVLGGAIVGEYCFYFPSTDGQMAFCNRASEACSTVADSAMDMIIGSIRVTYDSSASDSVTMARLRMNSLGFMFDCLYPGNTTYRFWPSRGNFTLSLHEAIEINGITINDTVAVWDEAWGKYFGVPLMTRDETDTGTDGDGQGYTIHKIELRNPTDTSIIQTYAVGRYAQGSNLLQNETEVEIDLGDDYYELLSGGTYSAETADSTFLANAHWRVFVKDTLLANAGYTEAPSYNAQAFNLVSVDSIDNDGNMLGSPRFKGYISTLDSSKWWLMAGSDGGAQLWQTTNTGGDWTSYDFGAELDFHGSVTGNGDSIMSVAPIGNSSVISRIYNNVTARDTSIVIAGGSGNNRGTVSYNDGYFLSITRCSEPGEHEPYNIKYSYATDGGETWTNEWLDSLDVEDVRVGSVPFKDGFILFSLITDGGNAESNLGKVQYWEGDSSGFAVNADSLIVPYDSQINYNTRHFTFNVVETTEDTLMYLAWGDDNAFRVNWKRYNGGTGAWIQDTLRTSDYTDDNGWKNTITIINNRAVVGFVENDGTNSIIKYVHHNPSDSTWTTPVHIDSSTGVDYDHDMTSAQSSDSRVGFIAYNKNYDAGFYVAVLSDTSTNFDIPDTTISQVLSATDTTTTTFVLSDNFSLTNTVVDSVIFECSDDSWSTVASADTIGTPSDPQASTLSGLSVETEYTIRCRAWDSSASVTDTSNVLTITTEAEAVVTSRLTPIMKE